MKDKSILLTNPIIIFANFDIIRIYLTFSSTKITLEASSRLVVRNVNLKIMAGIYVIE